MLNSQIRDLIGYNIPKDQEWLLVPMRNESAWFPVMA